MSTLSRIILPDNGKNLMRRELAAAFEALGCTVTRVAPERLDDLADPFCLGRLLEAGSCLLLSINFQALERPRPRLASLAKAGSTAAAWCVDNPWNVLSGVRDPSWKTVPLFVADKSFVQPLRRAGAEKVFHLPLAACPDLFGAAEVPEPLTPAPIAFVGRLAFPGKEAFFAGIEAPAAMLREAEAHIKRGVRPDFDWWSRRLGLDPSGFWPGKQARVPALGAETGNLRLREHCLAQAAKAGAACTDDGPGLDIYGDAPAEPPAGVRFFPAVDYYSRLPGIYRRACYSLCCTSLLLPHGLNQRHFDVWTAGGVCLTDNTPGLDLFPPELTRPVTFQGPADLPRLVESLEKLPEHGRSALIRDWQALLQERHTYRHRAAYILEQTRP